jgi:hypothetical protein
MASLGDASPAAASDDEPGIPARPRQGARRRRAVIAVGAALVVVLLAYLGFEIWPKEDDGALGEGPTPGDSQSSTAAPADDLYSTDLPGGLCQQIADEFKWHTASDVSQIDEGDPAVRTRAYCQIYPADPAAVAQTGDPFLGFAVDVRVDAEELMTDEGAAERAEALPENPQDMASADWLALFEESSSFEEVYDCEGTEGGCDGEALTVPCQAIEFAGTYVNMQVLFSVRACSSGEFPQQEAGDVYGEVFTYLAGALPRTQS